MLSDYSYEKSGHVKCSLRQSSPGLARPVRVFLQRAHDFSPASRAILGLGLSWAVSDFLSAARNIQETGWDMQETGFEHRVTVVPER